MEKRLVDNLGSNDKLPLDTIKPKTPRNLDDSETYISLLEFLFTWLLCAVLLSVIAVSASDWPHGEVGRNGISKPDCSRAGLKRRARCGQ